MSRKEYSVEEKVRVSERYLRKEASARELALEIGLGARGRNRICEWAAIYEENGAEGFCLNKRRRKYSAKEKKKIVEEYLSGNGSLRSTARKNGIYHSEILRRWVKEYNSNKELRDSIPRQEMDVAMSKKTTLEERCEIVAYCLEHGKNYEETSQKYGVSYSQVYSWVRRSRNGGPGALEDRRRKKKEENELDEVERLRRENRELKNELERKDMAIEILKKVRGDGRM